MDVLHIVQIGYLHFKHEATQILHQIRTEGAERTKVLKGNLFWCQNNDL